MIPNVLYFLQRLMLLNIFKTVFLSSDSSEGQMIIPGGFSQNPALSSHSSSGEDQNDNTQKCSNVATHH